MTNLQLYNFKYLKLLNELRISNLQRYIIHLMNEVTSNKISEVK